MAIIIREMFVHNKAYDIFKLYPSIIFIIDGPIEITLRPIAITLAIIINNSVFIFWFLLGNKNNINRMSKIKS